MINKKNARSIMFTLLICSQNLSAWWGSNSELPYDIFQRQSSPIRDNIDWDATDSTYHLNGGVASNFLFDGDGRDKNGNRVGVYQIYSPKDAKGRAVESLGAVEEGAGVINPENDFATRFGSLSNADLGDVIINGTRGEAHFNLWGSISLPLKKIAGTVRFTSFLPIKSISTSKTSLASVNAANNISPSILDLTENGIAKELNKVANLQVSSWKNDNFFGDLYLLLSWHNVFEQSNDIVQKVGLSAQVGATIPLSAVNGYKNIYSIPSGADGAWGVPFSAGVDVYLKDNFRVFGGVDIYKLFNDNNLRRIRSSANQGSTLVPEAVRVNRKGGTLFRLSASAEVTSNTKMFWAGMGYQYGKKSAQTISVNTLKYSPTVVNASERWQEAEYHNALVYMGIDLTQYIEKFAPCVNFSMQYPFKGTRIALFKSLGIELTLKI